MALIGKIRKNFWLVLIVLGLALASFVIMDMVGASNRGGGAQADMGSVAGTQIDYRDFQRTEGALYSGSTDVYGRRNSLWNYFVEKAIVDKQAEGLGLGVSRDELMDLQFGTNLSPIIQGNFRDPQTGQVDRQQLQTFRQALENGEELNPGFRSFWAAQEKQIIKTAIQDKLNTMVAKAMYTPTWMVDLDNSISQNQVSFDYVRIPFSDIDMEVEVTDADVDAFIKENADQYIPDENTKVLEYAIMDVIPTSADSALWREDLTESIEEFKNTENDSIFTVNNGGFLAPIYGNAEDLGDNIKEIIPTLNAGDVYGPYIEGSNYVAVKVVDKRVVPDSVEAKHILRSVPAGSPASSFEAAEAYIDSLKNLLDRGVATFDSLAINNSQDGSASLGGDLGTFAQGRMVGPFNDACFNGEKGGLYTVRTQFGIHLIKVEDQIFNSQDDKYKLAYISTPITPSEDTQEEIFDRVADLVDKNRTIEEMRTALEGVEEMSFSTSAPVKENDYIFASLQPGQNSRDIIRWAFDVDTKVGDLSPSVYTVTDPVNYFNKQYVVVGLKNANDAGTYDVNSIRAVVEAQIMNEKKGEAFAKTLSVTDLAAFAESNETEVRSTNNVSFSMASLPGLGREPEVQAAALSLAEGMVSQPIVGNAGVYVIKPTLKSTSAVASNVPAKRRTMNSNARNQVNFGLIEALKEKYPIEDKRSTFY